MLHGTHMPVVPEFPFSTINQNHEHTCWIHNCVLFFFLTPDQYYFGKSTFTIFWNRNRIINICIEPTGAHSFFHTNTIAYIVRTLGIQRQSRAANFCYFFLLRDENESHRVCKYPFIHDHGLYLDWSENTIDYLEWCNSLNIRQNYKLISVKWVIFMVFMRKPIEICSHLFDCIYNIILSIELNLWQIWMQHTHERLHTPSSFDIVQYS